MDFFDKDFFDNDGVLQKRIRKFVSPINQTMILFKDEHELAMGGPLIGKTALLLENRVLIRLEGLFSEEVLWQTNGQYVALAKWSNSAGRHKNHKVCIIDVQNSQIGEFEDLMFVKQFTQFSGDTIECEYYEKQQSTRVFVGKVKDLRFNSLRKKNAA